MRYGYFEQLQLTYKPEEGPSEETELPSDEPVAPPSDIVSDVETAPPPPPPPPTRPQSSMDTGDLLVYYQFRAPYFLLYPV